MSPEWIIVRVAGMVIMCSSNVYHTSRALLTPSSPTRWDAQADAVNMIFSAKTQANPESSVGLMNMAGKGPEVLVTLTTDFGKVLDGMHRTKTKGRANLTTAIQVAGVRTETYPTRNSVFNFVSLHSSIDKTNHNGNGSSYSRARPSMKTRKP